MIRRFLFLAGGLFHLAAAETVPEPVPITRLADIRLMTSAEAAKSLPVRVTGVVTWNSPGRISGGFMIDQKGAGIFVVEGGDQAGGRKSPESVASRSLAVGDQVEVVGVTQAGGSAPCILAAPPPHRGCGHTVETRTLIFARPRGRHPGIHPLARTALCSG